MPDKNSPHEREVELAKEATDEDDEDEVRPDAQQEARREQADSTAEAESLEREVAAEEQENPDAHRDGEPFQS